MVNIVIDPCEPENCQAVKDECMKSTVCRELFEGWEETCVDVWNSTTSTCSDECRNATYELTNDRFGRNFMGCDCGLHHSSFLDGPKRQTEIIEIDQCFVRQSKMREVCGFNDAGQCQNCAAKKGLWLINCNV